MKNAFILLDSEFNQLAYDDFPGFSHLEKSDLDSHPFHIIGVTQREADAFRKKYGGKKNDYDSRYEHLLVSRETMANYLYDKCVSKDTEIADIYFGDNGLVIELTSDAGCAPREISIDTPAGKLRARLLTDPDNPGIDTYLLCDDGHEENLVVVEHSSGGECCEGEDHIPGSIIPEKRTVYQTVTLWSGNQHTRKVLTSGLLARVWDDSNREDPITIAFSNSEEG